MDQLPLGSVFADGYRIERVAGRGGMGVVYEATQLALDRRVALKVIAPELADDPVFRARFEREAKLAAALRHPHLVSIYVAGDADGALFLVMDFIEGRDLGAILTAGGPLSPPRAARILAQICSALDAAHGRGLVHRDIKPGNVLLEARPEGDYAYVTDFGLSKHVESQSRLTRAGMWVGTIDYVAPEQLQGAQVDRRADIYSLGCLLFQSLTGVTPYRDRPDVAKLWAQLHGAPPSLREVVPGLPTALDDVIRRAMAKDPSERFATAGEFARAALASAGPEQPSLPTGDGISSPTLASPAAPDTRVAVSAGTSAPSPAPRSTQLAAAPPHEAPSPATSREAPPPGAIPGAPPSGAATRASPTRGSREPSPSATAPAESPAAPAAPPPRPRSRSSPSRRRAALVGAVAVVAGVAALGGSFLWTRDEQRPGPSAPAEAPRGELRSNTTIRVGDRPFGVAVGAGRVWVANNGDDTISTLDPRTGKALGTLPLNGRPWGVAVGAGGVWVTAFGEDTVTRIDPRTLQPDPPISVGRHPSWVTVGAERIWTTSARSGGVSRIDPRLPETGAETFLSGETTRGIAATDGSVWLSHGSNLVSEIDSLTGGVLRRREVGRIPVGLTVAKGKLWVANSQADSVSRIDLRSGSAVGSPIRVGDKPWAVAFGEGAIWVANSGDHTVTRLDPDTGKRIGNPIRVGREPVAVTVAEGAVWVTNNDADTVSRLVP